MAFLGMRGNGDWVQDQRPKNFREGLLLLNPNGDTVLTGMSAMVGSEEVDDPEFYWWTKNLAKRYFALGTAGTFLDSALTDAYTDGTDPQPAAGDVHYVKVSAATVSNFRLKQVVMLEKLGDYRYRIRGRVVGTAVNGDNSYIAIQLLAASDGTYDINEVDRITIIGSAHPEGDTRPAAIAMDPTKYYNYTQIFRTNVSMTRTAMKTKLRTGDQTAEAKREALQLHGIDIEMALMFGTKLETVGENGKPLRYTHGIIPFLMDESATNGNVEAFGHGSAYSTADWLGTVDGEIAGEKFLNEKLEIIFRYGSTEKLALCGSGALAGLNRLAKAGADMNIQVAQQDYGIKVGTWITPHGTIHLKTHPLMTQNPAHRHGMLITEPSLIRQRWLTDTDYVPMPKGSDNGIDGIEEEWLTELGFELHHPPAHGYLDRIGLNYDETPAAT